MSRATKQNVIFVLALVGLLGAAAAVDLAATGDPRCLVMKCVVVK